MIELVVGETIVAPKALGSLPFAFLFPSPFLPPAGHHRLRIYVLHFLLDRRNHPEIRLCALQVEITR